MTFRSKEVNCRHGIDRSKARILLPVLKGGDNFRYFLQGLMKLSSKSILEAYATTLETCHKLFICLSLLNILNRHLNF